MTRNDWSNQGGFLIGWLRILHRYAFPRSEDDRKEAGLARLQSPNSVAVVAVTARRCLDFSKFP